MNASSGVCTVCLRKILGKMYIDLFASQIDQRLNSVDGKKSNFLMVRWNDGLGIVTV